MQQLESFILQQCKLASPPPVDPVKWGKSLAVEIANVGNAHHHAAGCRVLGSKNARTAINAYQSSLPIAGVPLDRRSAAERVFKDFLRSAEHQSFAAARGRKLIGLTRRPFLCNSGPKGAGKSVLQAFNLLWSVQQLGRIPIEITFSNDDDDDDGYGVDFRDFDDFERGISARLLDRVVAFHTGAPVAEKEQLKALVRAVCTRGGPFMTTSSCLPLARKVLGAPPDSPIFLAIDDVREIRGVVDPTFCLSAFSAAVYDVTPALYMSVTAALGCSHVAEFAIQSNRPLWIQPLPPIFPVSITAFEKPESLPPLLQVFAIEDLRKKLPRQPQDLQVYSALLQLLVSSGGHPRRLESLFKGLADFPISIGFIKRNNEGTKNNNKNNINVDTLSTDVPVDFGLQLQGWLTAERRDRLESEMNGCADFTSISGLAVATKRAHHQAWPDAVNFAESMARDAARAFSFPKSRDDTNLHFVFLRGTEYLTCSYMPNQDSHSAANRYGRAFIPFPVLEALCDDRDNSKPFGPLADALDKLGCALKRLHAIVQDESDESDDDDDNDDHDHDSAAVPGGCSWSKRLASVYAASVLLYARANKRFTLSDLSRSFGRDLADIQLRGGNVAFRESIQYFPRGPGEPTDNYEQPEQIFGYLKARPDTNGVVFQPAAAAANNPAGDWFAVFKTFNNSDYDFVLVVGQVDSEDEQTLRQPGAMQWRENVKRHFLAYCPASHCADSTKGNGKLNNSPRVKLLSLVCARPAASDQVGIEDGNGNVSPVRYRCIPAAASKPLSLPHESDQGMVDLDHMKTWLPTAGYNAEFGYRCRLRRMFGSAGGR